MSNRRLVVINIREVLRLEQLGQTDVEIARLLGCHRMTVAKYRKWARSEGLLEAELPDETTLHARLAASMPAALAHQESSSLTAYTDEIKELRARGVRMTAICRRLAERHGIVVGYEALQRLVRRL